MTAGSRRLGLLIALALWSATLPAQALTIDFDGLAGPNNAPFTGLTEGAFSLTPTSGDWREGFFVGNPTPSIFSFDAGASLLLTGSGTGLFRFESIDLGTGSILGGSYSYLITGAISGSDVLSFGGTFTGSGGSFSTIPSTDSPLVLDRLTIELTNIDISSFNVDDIVVTSLPIPEPAAALCFAAGVLLVGARLRRRRVLSPHGA